MENGIFQGIWCRKTMNGPCESLPAFIPAWCLSQWGTAGVCTLHMRPWCTRSCSAFSQEPFSYWVVLCDICKPFWHRMAFANSCGVVYFCNALSEILQAELSDMSYDVCSRSPEMSISQCNCPWEICYGGEKRGIIMENTLFFKSEWVCANVFPYVNFT